MLITSHMVWGYVFGKGVSRGRKIAFSIPLLILAGGLPDYDLFTRQPEGTLFGHHGISHSWLVIILISIPFFIKFGKQVFPYLLAVIQHPMFGDLVTNNVPLLFPLTLSGSGLNLFGINSFAAIGLEMLGFVLFVAVLMRSGDWKKQVSSTKWNKLWLLLWLPLLAVTAAQAMVYYEPDVATVIYSVYALISSIFLFGVGLFLAAGMFRKK